MNDQTNKPFRIYREQKLDVLATVRLYAGYKAREYFTRFDRYVVESTRLK